MFEKFMHGLLGTAPTGEDGQPVYDPRVTETADTYGMPASQVQRMQQDQRAQMLLKVGSTLLGASQAGPVGQRGRMLAGLGDAFTGEADMTKQIMNSAQARLYAEGLKDKKMEREQKQAVLKQLTSGTLPGYTPEAQSRLLALGPTKAYEIINAATAAEFKRPEWTTSKGEDGKEYQTNVQTGEKKLVGGGGVNITNAAESKEQSTVGEARGKRIASVEDKAANGYQALESNRRLSTLLEAIGEDQGKFFQMKSEVASALKGLGASDDTVARISGLKPGSLELGQAFEKFRQRAAMDLIGPGGIPGQNFSNADAERLDKSIVAATNMSGGNRLILELQRQSIQADIDASRDWAAYRERTKAEKGTPDFDKWQYEYKQRLEERSAKGEDRLTQLFDQINGKTQPAPGAAPPPPGGAVTVPDAQRGAAAPVTIPTPRPGMAPDMQRALAKAQAAIAGGADPRAVQQRLRDSGILPGEM